MICELCGSPEGSHTCPADAEKLLAENARLRAEIKKGATQIDGLLFAAADADRKLREKDLRNDELRNALEEIRKLEGPGLDGSSENRSGKIARLALEGHHGNCDLFDPFGRDKPCNCKQTEKRVQPSPKCEHVWEADGDRDVCKKCGTRANPVM